MKRENGFSLIELLIVIAIVGVISAIAIPQYSDYVTRSKLAEPASVLSETRVRLEQYFQDNRTYVGACAPNTVAPLPTARYFVYACPTLTATTFRVTATGVVAEGMSGFAFDINQANIRTTTALPAAWGVAPIACWVTKKGGAC